MQADAERSQRGASQTMRVPQPDRRNKPPPIWISFASGGLGSVLGCTACHPFDVLKVRLQVQGEGGARTERPAGMVGMARQIVRSQGVIGGFSRGLSGQVRASVQIRAKTGVESCSRRSTH